MPWVSSKEAQEALGISESGVRHRRKSGHIKCRPHPKVIGNFEYWIDGAEPETAPAEAAPAAPDVSDLYMGFEIEAQEYQLDERGGESHPYVFNADNDVYLFSLKSSKGVVAVPGDSIRALVQVYSNMVQAGGRGASQDEICRKFGWSRVTLQEILRALRKTKTSTPFTDEQLAEMDIEDGAQDMLRMKEQNLVTKFERLQWEKTKKDAEKFRSLKFWIFDRLEKMELPTIPRPVRVRRKDAAEKLSVLAHPSDLHYGADGWAYDGSRERYSKDVCSKRLAEKAGTMVERVTRYGVVEDWIVGVGGDWFHVDTPSHTTTRGTPQDVDGTFTEALREGCALAEEYVQILRGAGAVNLYFSGGNHDWSSSMFLLLWLQARFKGAPDVTVHHEVAPRIYLERGKNLICLHHGDGAKPAKMPTIMLHEASDMLSRCPHRIIASGHEHHEEMHDRHGLVYVKMPSLASTDRWHAREGWVGSRKALNAYVLDHDEGLVARISASV